MNDADALLSPSPTLADASAAPITVRRPRGLSRPLAATLAGAVFVLPWAMSRSTQPTPDHPRVFGWYRRLDKPAFKPPDVAIPIAWTAIEAGLAVAAYRLLRQAPTPPRNRSLGWLALNVAAIGGWSRLFFGRRHLPASTLAAGAMVVSGTAYVLQARRSDRVAAAAGVPFTAWVAFATVLTAALWRRN